MYKSQVLNIIILSTNYTVYNFFRKLQLSFKFLNNQANSNTIQPNKHVKSGLVSAQPNPKF